VDPAIGRGVKAALVSLEDQVEVRILPAEPRGRANLRAVSDLPPAALVVLAAGQGTRMRSARPKVLFEIGGRTLLGHVLAAAAPLGAFRRLVVVGHGREAVAAELARLDPEAVAVVQEEQRGTGHAVRTALDAVARLPLDRPVVVLPGDAPLLSPGTLRSLVDAHTDSGAAATLLTARLPDPTGYGRVRRGPGGAVEAIVEQRDADAATLGLDEVNTGVYVFTAGPLLDALTQLGRDNAAGEEYLTDVVALLRVSGEAVAATLLADHREALGVNDRVQLAAAGALLRTSLLEAHMRNGVTVVDPATTWVDAEVVLEPDVTLLPGTALRGATTVQRGATIGPGSTLTDTTVRAGATVASSTAVGAEVGPDSTVGPYAYLRPGTRLGRRAKVGAYVEAKAAVVGDDAKVPHLSYVGDVTIGPRSNIGAGTIVVNYDGVDKHRTAVGADVRIGSNNSLVAPLVVGDGAYTAAGSVLTGDVPPGALGVGRARQRNVEGWVARRRPPPPAAPAEG